MHSAPTSRLTRRSVLALGAGGAFSALRLGLTRRAFANTPGLAHAYSSLGAIKYPSGFTAFDYVNPAAPRGGTMRLAPIGGFDTANTLTYPGRPPSDIRLMYDRLIVASDDERATYFEAASIGYRETMVFRDLTLSLPQGRITALCAPNGSGQSTALRALRGLLGLEACFTI